MLFICQEVNLCKCYMLLQETADRMLSHPFSYSMLGMLAAMKRGIWVDVLYSILSSRINGMLGGEIEKIASYM